MNYSNMSNASNISRLAPVYSPSPLFNTSEIVSPSIVNSSAPAPVLLSPSPSLAPVPSEYTPSPVPSIEYESGNFSSATGTPLEHRAEVDFFLSFVAISFVVLLVFLYATRGYISNLWREPREFIEIEQDDADMVELKSGVFSSSGESKSSYVEHKEDMGIARGEMGYAIDI